MTTHDISLEDRLKAAKVAALKAAAKILAHYHPSGTTLEVKQKSPSQPVTQADLEANVAIRETIAPFLRTDAWLSEEDVDDGVRLQNDFVWIVDPLDGTRDFIVGNPEFTVSIGLAFQGQPVLGVICNPVTNDLFFGARGLGVWQNDKRVQMTQIPNADPHVLVSRSEFRRGDWTDFQPRARIVPCGGSANKLAQVAAGHADAALTFIRKSEWDICAGAALILANGGKITDAQGLPLVFNQKLPQFQSVFYANPTVHEALLRQMRSL